MAEYPKIKTPDDSLIGEILPPGGAGIPEAVGMTPEADEVEDEGLPPEPSPPEAKGCDVWRAASIVESLLLVSSRPLSLDKMGEIAGGLSRAEAKEVVCLLKEKYSPGRSGIVLEEVAKGFQLRTNPANQDFVRKLFDAKPPRFSRAALETLAIVAYKQPVTRLEIEQIRGVDCAASIRTLMERRLIKVAGKKNVPGKPFLFVTSREFLEVFGLSALSDLPSLRDIEDFLAASPGGGEGAKASAGDKKEDGGGSEFGQSLLEADPGEPFVQPSPGVSVAVSEDVLSEAASLEAGLSLSAEDEKAPAEGATGGEGEGGACRPRG